MVERADLEAAADAGLIAKVQVTSLHDFLTARTAGGAPPATAAAPVAARTGEEELRFIRNFHDVFLAIGIILFAVGLAVGIGSYVSEMSDAQRVALNIGIGAGGAAVVMWLLGELFARRRRLFLPAIAIVLALTMFVAVSAATLYASLLLGQGFEGRFDNMEQLPPELRLGILTAVASAAIAPLLFYARFRLPFSLGLTGGMWALFVVVAALVYNPELTMNFLPTLYLVLGVMLFLAGVGFDMRDPERATRLSDNGFWLHFAAAPLILNGAFGLVGQIFTGGTAPLTPHLIMAGEGRHRSGGRDADHHPAAGRGVAAHQPARAYRLGPHHHWHRHRHHHERGGPRRGRSGGRDLDHARRVRADPGRGVA